MARSMNAWPRLRRAFAAFAAGLLLCAGGGHAQALTIKWVVTGELAAGSDPDGFFFGGPTDLAGLPVRFDFIFDTDAAFLLVVDEPTHIEGVFGAPSRAVITINGVSQEIPANDYAGLWKGYSSAPVTPGAQAYVRGETGIVGLEPATQGSAEYILFHPDLPADAPLSAPLDMTGGEGSFQLAYTSRVIWAPGEGETHYAEGYLKVGAARLVVPALVPEPATWAVMVLGFGAIGATLRRRRAIAACVA